MRDERLMRRLILLEELLKVSAAELGLRRAGRLLPEMISASRG
jgi:hypothetical protein